MIENNLGSRSLVAETFRGRIFIDVSLPARSEICNGVSKAGFVIKGSAALPSPKISSRQAIERPGEPSFPSARNYFTHPITTAPNCQLLES